LAGIVAQSDPGIGPLPGLKLTALRSVKILGSAVPGNVVRLEAQVTGRLGNLVQADVKASVKGQVVMTGQLTLSGATA
jgi:3-hydroxyacyl-[acyl-carrier-protein] dehydratase